MEILTKTDIRTLFESQQHKALRLKKSTSAERIVRLAILKQALSDATDAILQALYDDFKKPAEEAKLELSPIFDEIDFTVAYLEGWMQPQITTTPDALGGAAAVSRIVYEPKGTCLLITPWNYPFLLTFRPLVACLAAGNTAIIKPSELTPHSSTLMRQIIENAFSEDEIGRAHV